MTLPISGTGSSGMEACFVNLVEKDDPVLILINGVFGMRMQDVATRLGAQVDTLEFEWGKPVDVDRLREGGAVGRTLDFLCQEVLRELNTLGSKCREVGVGDQLVEAKAATERMREQVQNLE